MNAILSAAASLAPAEATLLAAFRAMDDDSRADMLAVMSAIAERFPRQRPRLRLVSATTHNEVETLLK